MISVIIPTYKRNDNLKRAIDSVLSQDGDFEIIVVDDNDPDSVYRKNNIELIKQYKNISKFHYLQHEKNRNGAAARNTGIKFAKGDYITFLDDDDEFLPDRIKKAENAINKLNCDLIITAFNIKKNNVVIGTYHPKILSNKRMIIDLLGQKSFFGTGSNFICKKTIIDSINGFDESFLRHQDIEFMIRFLEKTEHCNLIDEVLVCKHVDDRNNMQPFDKMVHIKEMFLKKFDYILKSVSPKIKKRIIIKNYYELLNTAYMKKDKEEINKCIYYLKKNNMYFYFLNLKIAIKVYIKNNIFYKIKGALNK